MDYSKFDVVERAEQYQKGLTVADLLQELGKLNPSDVVIVEYDGSVYPMPVGDVRAQVDVNGISYLWIFGGG